MKQTWKRTGNFPAPPTVQTDAGLLRELMAHSRRRGGARNRFAPSLC
jgi:hypothetical protein